MLVIGVTGGIGSGKSTVGGMLAERGCVVVDADELARAALEPGGEAYAAVVEEFGERILAPGGGGRIDRDALAAVVFADPEARTRLNGLVHPVVRHGIARVLGRESATDHVVVLDIPLLVEAGGPVGPWSRLPGVIVVDAPEEVRIARLAEGRGMAEEEVRERIAAQASREERLAHADFVIDNSGDRASLEAEVRRAWEWIGSLRGAAAAS